MNIIAIALKYCNEHEYILTKWLDSTYRVEMSGSTLLES